MTEKYHKEFLGALDRSQPAKLLIADILSRQGYQVTVLPSSRSPTHAEAKDHGDEGDLLIGIGAEVKHLGFDFTCREDWPHPTFIVCEQHQFDRKRIPPARIYHVNKAKTHIAIVYPKESRADWVKEKTHLRSQPDLPRDNYVLRSLDKVHFFEL